MDLSAAIEAVADLATKAGGAEDKVKFLAIPNDPLGAFAVVKSNGELEIRYPNNPPRQHTLKSVDQVAAFVEDASNRLAATTSVWYDRSAVIVLLQDKAIDLDRRAMAKVPLNLSPEFKVLQKEASTPQERLPKLFINWIRQGLIDAIPHVDELLKLLRAIKFNVNESGHSKLSQGRESLGREIEAEALSEIGDIPETIVCEIRVFDDPSIKRRAPVRCNLDVNPRTCEFTFSPLEADLIAAVDEELANIGELIRQGVTCPVFYGTP